MQPDYSAWSLKAVSVRALYEGFTGPVKGPNTIKRVNFEFLM